MRLKFLDVLKAIAIIAVVLYHSGYLTYGYLGVDLFLVINGYFITKGLCNKVFNNTSSRMGEYISFELSRIVRLLPVLLLASCVCMALGYYVMLPDDYENLSQSVIATNFFSNNILAAITTKNYWDVVNEYKPLMHTWYVGLVMQFYVVYPLLFYIARFNKKNPYRTLLILICVLLALSLMIYFLIKDDAQRFYYLPSRFFEFAVGGIVALIWKQNENSKLFRKIIAYLCYASLISLILINQPIMPSNIRLVIVVALSVVLISSSTELENVITGNNIIAKIGAASYSIFVWHQILLAFYRYSISSEFTILSYILLVTMVGVLSWLTYKFIEQKTSSWLKEKKLNYLFYSVLIVVFTVLNTFAAYIYLHAGVVRDVPELYISKDNIHRGLHSEYNDKIYLLNKPFETERLHWLVVGNSFGRDFANVILESTVADSVEVSYIPYDDFNNAKYSDRYASADMIFFSSLGANEKKIAEVEHICKENGFDIGKLIMVGTKNFGESNGQFYFHRNRPDYFLQRTKMEDGYLEVNQRLKDIYGNRYLDLIALVIDRDETVPVFTPDHHYISQDCRHFSKGGAIWFAQLIRWDIFFKK